MKYAPLGEGMLVCDVLDGAIPGHHAGYVHLRGGTLVWTLQANEVMWVVEGQVTLTHGGQAQLLNCGDMVLLGEGGALEMSGTPDAKTAWFSVPPSIGAAGESANAEDH